MPFTEGNQVYALTAELGLCQLGVDFPERREQTSNCTWLVTCFYKIYYKLRILFSSGSFSF